MRQTGPLQQATAARMRAAAQQLDKTHPETTAAGHVRDAATTIASGRIDGSKRHLDAAMEVLTPRNLMRHGILDDQGHTTAKQAMHSVHRLRLAVMDIEDIRTANEAEQERRRSAAETERESKARAQAIRTGAFPQPTESDANGNSPPQAPTGKAQPNADAAPGSSASAGSQPPVSTSAPAAPRAAAPPPRTTPARPRPPVAAGKGAKLSNEIELGYNPAQPRDTHGRWTGSGGSRFYWRGKQVSRDEYHHHINESNQVRGLRTQYPSSEHIRKARAHIKAAANSAQLADRHIEAAKQHALAAQGAEGFTHLPPDITAALRGYDQSIAAGKIKFGTGEFAGKYPGQARSARSLNQFLNSKPIGYSNQLAAIELSAQTARLAATPHPNGRPGGPGLYGKKGNKHSDYFEQIVHALMTKRGMSQADASRIAWGALRKWQRGGGNVHPEVRAAAAGALAKEAAAKLSNSQRAIELAGPHGYEHGWVFVGTGPEPSDYKPGPQPGKKQSRYHSRTQLSDGNHVYAWHDSLAAAKKGTSSIAAKYKSHVDVYERADAGASMSNIQRAIELVGPEGFIHGWIFVGKGGSAEHIAALRSGAGTMRSRYGDEAGNHISAAADALERKDYEGARGHLTDAYSAVAARSRAGGVNIGSEAHRQATSDLQTIKQHMGKVQEAADEAQAAQPRKHHLFSNDPWDMADRLIDLVAGGPQWQSQTRTPLGQFGSNSQSGGSQPRGKAARRAKRAQLIKKAAGIRAQIRALLAMLPAHKSSASHKSKSSTPAKKGAAATSAKAAAAAKASSTKAKTAARHTMSTATIHAKIAALRAELAATLRQIHQLSNEDQGAIELSYRDAWRTELRGKGGQFARSPGSGAAHIPFQSGRVSRDQWRAAHPAALTRPLDLPKQVSPEPGEDAKQDATRRALLAFTQRQIETALTTPPQQMTPQQLDTSIRVVTGMTHHDVARLNEKLAHVVTEPVAGHVKGHLETLRREINRETQKDAKHALIFHVAMILGAVGISLAAGGLGVPAGIAAIIAVTPALAQELRDWRAAQQTISNTEKVSPREIEHTLSTQLA